MEGSKISKKRTWAKQEDHQLIEYVRTHSEDSWSSVSQATGLQCCEKSRKHKRCEYPKEGNSVGNFGEDEEDLLIKLYALLGDRWSLIAGRLPGRKDDEVKNHWDSHLSKKLIDEGFDLNSPKSLLSYEMIKYQRIATTSTPRDSLEEVSHTGSNTEGTPSELEDMSDLTSRKR